MFYLLTKSKFNFSRIKIFILQRVGFSKKMKFVIVIHLVRYMLHKNWFVWTWKNESKNHLRNRWYGNRTEILCTDPWDQLKNLIIRLYEVIIFLSFFVSWCHTISLFKKLLKSHFKNTTSYLVEVGFWENPLKILLLLNKNRGFKIIVEKYCLSWSGNFPKREITKRISTFT